jgi:hypothetical protein
MRLATASSFARAAGSRASGAVIIALSRARPEPIDQPNATAHPHAAQEMLAQLQAPSQGQLAKPPQFVTLHNTGEQTHFIIDRYNPGHEFLGKQKKRIEMTTDGIATLRHLARTDRGIYPSGQKKGQPFPPHPVRIIDVGPIRCNGVEEPVWVPTVFV